MTLIIFIFLIASGTWSLSLCALIINVIRYSSVSQIGIWVIVFLLQCAVLAGSIANVFKALEVLA